MEEGVLLFRQVTPDIEFISDILKFDVSRLESTDGATISKYAMALAQYLIYFKSQTNSTRAELHKKKRLLESGINQLITKEVLKTYKTKADAANSIIANSADLSILREEVEKAQDELILVEDIDKMFFEWIATFKRELTRRENELYSIRKERAS